jgi:uncharacterized RDD family membrane protein YckC
MDPPERPTFSVAGLPPAYETPGRPDAPAAQGKAAWGYRMAGGLVDFSVPVAIASVIDATGHSTSDAEGYAGISLFVTWILNVGVLAGLTNGRSIGKLLVGTRVVRESGGRFGVGMALLRDVVVRLIHIVPLVIVVDALLPLSDSRRSLRDRIVSTDVVRAPSPARGPAAATVATFAVLVLTWFAMNRTDVFHEDYSDYTRQQFIGDCSKPGTSERTCACAFERIRTQLTFEEYQQARHLDPEDRSRPARVIEDAVAACR